MKQFEIGQNLLTVDWGNIFNGLKFEQQSILYDNISTEALIKLHAHECNRHGNLTAHIQTLAFQHFCEHYFIDRFQQARPCFDMQTIRKIHNNRRKFFHVPARFDAWIGVIHNVVGWSWVSREGAKARSWRMWRGARIGFNFRIS